MGERTALESLLIPKKSEKDYEEVIDQDRAKQDTKFSIVLQDKMEEN